MKRSTGTRVRTGVFDGLSRIVLLGGIGCAYLVTRSPWWLLGAVPLLGAGVWLAVLEARARRNIRVDEAVEASEEYDRMHPSEAPPSSGTAG